MSVRDLHRLFWEDQQRKLNREEAAMRPSVKFLAKVRDGGVKLVFGYSDRSGGYHRFVGGEKTAERHAKLGYITMPGAASLGRPALATLTTKGKAALNGRKAKVGGRYGYGDIDGKPVKG
jgi:hypothetical protein